MRDYQFGYADRCGIMYDVASRERKAQSMLAVLADFLHRPLRELRLVNVGGSAGIIDNFLADHFGSVMSLDIDAPAIASAQKAFHKPNLEFRVGDALRMEFADASFDVAICSQVYEHVPDAQKMMDEIFRVLVPGGVCFFGANNRLMWNEPHYNLPLLSVIPRPLADLYVRVTGKGSHYHELHYFFWGLRKLVRRFIVHDYMPKMIHDPEKFSFGYMIAPGSLKAVVGSFIANHCRWLSPGFIWLLEKPGNGEAA